MIVVIINLESSSEIPTFKSAFKLKRFIENVFLFVKLIYTLQINQPFFLLLLLLNLLPIICIRIFKNSANIKQIFFKDFVFFVSRLMIFWRKI